jgi:hypothetical protein
MATKKPKEVPSESKVEIGATPAMVMVETTCRNCGAKWPKGTKTCANCQYDL